MRQRTQVVSSPLENFILEVLSKNAKEVLRPEVLRDSSINPQVFSSIEGQIPEFYNLEDGVQIWYDGVGKPDNSEGKNYDYSIDVVSGDLYKKIYGSWERIGAVSGPKGPKGDLGPEGPIGPIGPEGPKGRAAEWFDGIGEPSSLLGDNGDRFLEIETGDIYAKQSGRWERIGNIMGKTVNWHSGIGAPSYGIGDYLDWYLDKNTGNLYKKEEYDWVLIIRLSDAFRATQEFKDMVQLIADGNLIRQEESVRVSNEQNRVNAENTRKTAESSRAAAESARVTVEQNRVNAENTRKTKENERQQAEELRNSAELVRESSETNRGNAETNRVAEESIRKTQETIRQSQEVAREAKMSDYERRFNEVLENDTSAEVMAAREGHANLKDRLNKGGTPSYVETTGVNNVTVDDTFLSKSDVLLEGNTLVNELVGGKEVQSTGTGVRLSLLRDLSSIKLNTDYTLVFTVDNSTTCTNGVTRFRYNDATFLHQFDGNWVSQIGFKMFKVNFTKPFVSNTCFEVWCRNSGEVLSLSNVTLLEGDYTTKPVPTYFEGLKSVAQTNSNKIEILSCGENLFSDKTVWNDGWRLGSDGTDFADATYSLTEYIKVPKFLQGSQVYLTSANASYVAFYTSNTPSSFIVRNVALATFTVPTNALYMRIANPKDVKSIALYKGSTAKPYTPYVSNKTDILNRVGRSTPSVKDTFEVKDGKCIVTQKCGEYIVNGTENFTNFSNSTNMTNCPNNVFVELLNFNGAKSIELVSDKARVFNINIWNQASVDGVIAIAKNISGNNNTLQISIPKTLLTTQDMAGFKTWLQANPITIVYELATPIKEEFELPSLPSYRGQTNYFVDGGAIPIPFSVVYDGNISAVAERAQKRVEKLEEILYGKYSYSWDEDLQTQIRYFFKSGALTSQKKVNGIWVDA